jgi:sarcosine oxidase subunit alpha
VSEPHPRTPDCAIEFEGAPVAAVAGEPVAVALFAAGTRVLSRSVKYHRPRGFFCLAGHCGACLMRIDGQPNMKACRAPAREGLTVERQNAFPSGGVDVLAAADLFFPRGMDHHTMFTHPRAVNTLMQKVVRQLGGLGRLPDRAITRDELPRGRRLSVDVAVVGAGPAGLAAATACARASGARVVVFDEGDRAGGSLLTHPAHGPAAADALARTARDAGVEIRTGAAAIAWYPEDEGGLLAVDEGGTLARVTARRYLYATGAYDVNALFADNDRPGILAARAVGALLARYGVVPAARPAVLGDGPYAHALADALEAAGCAVSRIDGARERVVAARGRTWITGVDVAVDGEKPRRVKCDLLAVAALPAPATELLRQHGAAVALRPEAGGFACLVDGRGQTRAPGVFACGDACGFRGVDGARAHGAEVGRAVGESLA